MPKPTSLLDPSVKGVTASLVSYLREYLSKLQPDTVRDGVADSEVFWLANVKHYVSGLELELPAPPSGGAPAPPGEVRQQLADETAWRSPDGPVPTLSATADDSVRDHFDRWLPSWRQWAAEEKTNRQLRNHYSSLDRLRREAANGSDTHELVLGVGLITIARGGCWAVRRHLLVSDVTVTVDPSTETLRVVLPSTPNWKVEDREFLTTDDGFLPDRSSIAPPEGLAPDDDLDRWLDSWWRRSWGAELAAVTTRWAPPQNHDDDVAELALAPALLLRPRSQNERLRMYDVIADYLSRPDQPAPAGLAALVAPDSAPRVNELSSSGLFPLPSNREQRRILEKLRTDSAVVVQGPPGTGKTHTIANLICALLADGQRVLITSQKDQALRVLRDQLPAEIRQLCVLMTGMNRTGTDELNRSLVALSQQLADVDEAKLEREIETLQRQRRELSGQIRNLTIEVRAARLQEYLEHPVLGPDEPPRTLADAAQFIVDGRPRHEWIGSLPWGAPAQPPLTNAEASELLPLLRDDTPERAERGGQEIPGSDDIPSPPQVAAAVAAVADGRQILGADADGAWALAELNDDVLREIAGYVEVIAQALTGCGLTDTIADWNSDDWRSQAVRALLRRHDVAYWNTLLDDAMAVTAHHAALTAIADREVDVQTGPGTTVTPRRLLHQAVALREHLSAGHRISRFFRAKPVLRAADLLSSCTVNGLPPQNASDLDAVIITLRAELAVSDAAGSWAETGVRLAPGPLRRRLAQFQDIAAAVPPLRLLVTARDSIDRVLRKRRVLYSIGSAERWDLLVRVTRATGQLQQARSATRQLAEFEYTINSWAQKFRAAPELRLLLVALREHDVDTFAGLSDRLDQARIQQRAGRALLEMMQRLGKAHPTLADELRADPHAQRWDERLTDFERSWTWGYARQWFEENFDVGSETHQDRALDEAERQLLKIIRDLASRQALLCCFRRSSPEQRRALQQYRSAMATYGRGTSAYKARYLAAARAAMGKASAAVPAWVMPLPEIAENIPARPNLFDVVIVDEASQAPVDALFLLWLAPRVVVVGDEEQCTPRASTATDLGTAYRILDRHLPTLDQDQRHSLAPNSNLYDLMSTRADDTIRLSEHFRSMPEIIGWSSKEFYDHRLIPLRQFGVDRLDPLKIVQVLDAEEKFSASALRNEAEALAIVERIKDLIADPGNRNRTIGVVVLQDCYQIKLIERELRKSVSGADLERFKIRVGTAPDFQGEQRHIILLSTVATRKRSTLSAPTYRRQFNVAASRARDQMWLFTSLDMSTLEADDLRYKLFDYMQNRPSHHDPEPAADLARPDELQEPFESIFQQRVFIELRSRGFDVIPQYEIDDKRIDFLVTGERGRLAIECDGPSIPCTADQIDEDIRRERLLRRCDWRIIRIRESEFILDQRTAFQALWDRLAERGIEPRRPVEVS